MSVIGITELPLSFYEGKVDRMRNEISDLNARVVQLEAALRLVDADVRHHLRDAYENADSIPAAMIRPQAIKAVRDALQLSQ